MKRVILLFAAVLLASIGWSQTMVITLNDGTTVKYDMGIVKSIEFTDEESGSNQETTPSIVGTWKLINADAIIQDINKLLIYRFRDDGTFTRIIGKDENSSYKIENGSWKKNNTYLTIQRDNGGAATCTIVEFETNKLTLLDALGDLLYFERVSDSEIEKYL
jgi:hypothetical protein